MKQPLSRKEKFYLDAFNRGRASAEKELAAKDAEIERLRGIVERVAHGFNDDCFVRCSEYGCGCKQDLTHEARQALSEPPSAGESDAGIQDKGRE